MELQGLFGFDVVIKDVNGDTAMAFLGLISILESRTAEILYIKEVLNC